MVRSCYRCFFLKNQDEWFGQCTVKHPVTGRVVVWLSDTGDAKKKSWHIGCLLCQGQGFKNVFAKFQAQPKLCNILRHAECDQHKEAVEAFQSRGEKVDGEPEPETRELEKYAVGYCHFIFQRTLLATGSSFTSFPKWIQSAQLSGADIPHGAIGDAVSRQLLQTMADRERQVNMKLFAHCSAAGLQQDGRGDAVAVTCKMVLWRWPPGLSTDPPVHGVLSLNNGKAPWIVCRVAALTELKADRGADALLDSLESTLCKHSQDENNLKDIAGKIWFVTTDGAADELSAGRKFMNKHRNVRFHFTDECHTAMLALKKVLSADPEIEEVERLLVSGKRPYSVAKWLSTSDICAAHFKDEERADAVSVLENLSWAMQRFDSRKKPLARICLRLQQVFGALASVAESKHKMAADARKLLESLSGDHTNRLVLAAMLADLCWEHSAWVHFGDFTDPCPVALEAAQDKFFLRHLNNIRQLCSAVSE